MTKRTPRAGLTLCALLLVAVCEATPPTYEQATKLNETLADNAQLKTWLQAELKPFLSQNTQSAVSSCIEMLAEGQTTTRLVVDLHALPDGVMIYDSVPTPFSNCVRDKLKAMDWPKAPEEIRYLPLAINADRPKEGPQNADDAIISITPSSK